MLKCSIDVFSVRFTISPKDFCLIVTSLILSSIQINAGINCKLGLEKKKLKKICGSAIEKLLQKLLFASKKIFFIFLLTQRSKSDNIIFVTKQIKLKQNFKIQILKQEF